MIEMVLIAILTCNASLCGAQVNIITTIAGTGVAGYSGDGGPATTAELNRPCALTLDDTGNVLVCDGLNHCIRKISNSTGAITTICGNGIPGFSGDGGDAFGAQLTVPQGVSVRNYEIYVADAGN